MTKNKLATLAGINKNSLIDLKMGRKKSLKFEDVVKIADALDISLDEFRKGWGVLTKKQRLREQFLEPKKALASKKGKILVIFYITHSRFNTIKKTSLGGLILFGDLWKILGYTYSIHEFSDSSSVCRPILLKNKHVL